ncbi:hypothetical protein C8R46DRAFT_1035892 [Mycena filopes]|nr:hypothetical protein C8R46DRAFT_1035892 [Mycena filopes]
MGNVIVGEAWASSVPYGLKSGYFMAVTVYSWWGSLGVAPSCTAALGNMGPPLTTAALGSTLIRSAAPWNQLRPFAPDHHAKSNKSANLPRTTRTGVCTDHLTYSGVHGRAAMSQALVYSKLGEFVDTPARSVHPDLCFLFATGSPGSSPGATRVLSNSAIDTDKASAIDLLDVLAAHASLAPHLVLYGALVPMYLPCPHALSRPRALSVPSCGSPLCAVVQVALEHLVTTAVIAHLHIFNLFLPFAGELLNNWGTAHGVVDDRGSARRCVDVEIPSRDAYSINPGKLKGNRTPRVFVVRFGDFRINPMINPAMFDGVWVSEGSGLGNERVVSTRIMTIRCSQSTASPREVFKGPKIDIHGIHVYVVFCGAINEL